MTETVLLQDGTPTKDYDSMPVKTTKQIYSIPSDSIGRAAFVLRDLIINGSDSFGFVSHNPYAKDKDSDAFNKLSMICNNILINGWYRVLIKITVLTLITLSFIEPPDWCLSEEIDSCPKKLGATGIPLFVVSENDPSEADYYPNFNMMLLNDYQSRRVEWACLALLLVHTILKICQEGASLKNYFDAKSGTKNLRIVQLATILINVGSLIVGHERHFCQILRLVIYITMESGVRREIATITKMVPEISSTFFIIFVITLFYAWFGVLMFEGTEEGLLSFSTLSEAMWSLYLLALCANYPDVMMPILNENRATIVFFVSFVIIVFYFLMNVVLSQIVNVYNDEADKSNEILVETNKMWLKRAFHILNEDGDNAVDKETCMALFTVLNEKCPEVSHVDPTRAKLLFSLLDADGSNGISENEFMDFGLVMMLEFEVADDHEPPSFISQKICKIVRSEAFDNAIDYILILNAMLVAYQTYPLLSGLTDHLDEKNGITVWDVVDMIFTTIFVIEACLKIMIMGWKSYSGTTSNLFDFAITLFAVLTSVYVYSPNGYDSTKLIRYSIMARVFRLSRLLGSMQSFNLIYSTMMSILPAAKRVFLMLFCVLYIFSAIGVYFFGGMITRDPDNPMSEKLRGTGFAESAYWSNNFNDMMSGINTLFAFAILGFIPALSDVFVTTTGTKFPRLFFLVFNIVGNIIVNNVVVAFVIDSFLNKLEDNDRKTSTSFDAATVTGTKTSISGQVEARFKRGMQFFSSKQKSAYLRQLSKAKSEEKDGVLS